MEEGAEKGSTIDYVASARTDPVFSLFYRVENEYRSQIDGKQLISSGFVTTIDEKKRKGATTVRFDRDRRANAREEWISEGEKPRVLERVLEGSATQDPLSAILYLRTQPLKLGDVWSGKVLVGKEILNFRISVTGEEKLPTKIGDIPAWVLTPEVVKPGEASEPLNNQIWIGKDGAHPLLKLKAKLKIGSVILYLRDFHPAPGAPGAAAG